MSNLVPSSPRKICEYSVRFMDELIESLDKGKKHFKEFSDNIDKDPDLADVKFHIEKLTGLHQYFVSFTAGAINLDGVLEQFLSTLKAKK